MDQPLEQDRVVAVAGKPRDDLWRGLLLQELLDRERVERLERCDRNLGDLLVLYLGEVYLNLNEILLR